MCERVVGDAEEAAEGSRRECTTEKQEPHTMMGGIAYLETNRIEYVKKCVVTCNYAQYKYISVQKCAASKSVIFNYSYKCRKSKQSHSMIIPNMFVCRAWIIFGTDN